MRKFIDLVESNVVKFPSRFAPIDAENNQLIKDVEGHAPDSTGKIDWIPTPSQIQHSNNAGDAHYSATDEKYSVEQFSEDFLYHSKDFSLSNEMLEELFLYGEWDEWNLMSVERFMGWKKEYKSAMTENMNYDDNQDVTEETEDWGKETLSLKFRRVRDQNSYTSAGKNGLKRATKIRASLMLGKLSVGGYETVEGSSRVKIYYNGYTEMVSSEEEAKQFLLGLFK